MKITHPLLFTLIAFAVLTCSAQAQLESKTVESDILPCAPESDFFVEVEGGPNLDFCSEWNPEFAYRGGRCCAKPQYRGRRLRDRCDAKRAKATYCEEMTDEQKRFREQATSGKLGDVLVVIGQDLQRQREQTYCSVNNGFLAWGREIIPTSQNRIQLRTPWRCLSFGTDGMVAMLEWTGRQIEKEYAAPEYKETRLMVGDISAPRGGCLTGRGGKRRGHSSHTSGLDADLGFLTPLKSKPSPPQFHKQFDVQANWWLIKQMFKNPYVCIKAMFLDKRLIHQLAKKVGKDPEWPSIGKYIKHVKGHRNHIHVRVGTAPGKPGCPADDWLEDDGEDEGDEGSEKTE